MAYRTAVAALLLTVIALTAPMAASSAAPTLGLRVTSEVWGDQSSPELLLASRANVPTTVTMNLPSDWRLERTTLQLQPGQEVTMPFTRTGATGTLQLFQTMTDPPPEGQVAGALQVNTKLLSSRPTPAMDWTPAFLMLTSVLVLLFLALAAIRWVTRNYALTRR